MYFRDHEPAHVHAVKGGGAEVIIWLSDPVAVREIRGTVSPSNVRRALEIAQGALAELIEYWKEVQGR